LNFDHLIKYFAGGAASLTTGFLLCFLVPLILGLIFAKYNSKPPNWRGGGERGRLLSQYFGLLYLAIAILQETEYSWLEKIGLYGIFAPLWIFLCYILFETTIFFQERVGEDSKSVEIDYKSAVINTLAKAWIILIDPFLVILNWLSCGYSKKRNQSPTNPQQNS
jgi:hypothetical protein